jgi:hypothetical protein
MSAGRLSISKAAVSSTVYIYFSRVPDYDTISPMKRKDHQGIWTVKQEEVMC